MTIANSKAAQKTLGQHRRDLAQMYQRDMGAVLSTPEGRRFVYALIDVKCRLFGLSYTGNSETYVNEGRRMVGFELSKEIQEDYPNLWIQMLSEQFNLKQRERLVEEAASAQAEHEE